MSFLDGHYLLSGDGTGFYSSEKATSPSYCMGKRNNNGNILYYQQMHAAAFMHPDRKEVIPVFPEMITRKDGTNKNDCERNASRRFYEDFRREHPHLLSKIVPCSLVAGRAAGLLCPASGHSKNYKTCYLFRYIALSDGNIAGAIYVNLAARLPIVE